MRKYVFILLITAIVAPYFGYGQEGKKNIDMTETIKYLNGKFNGKYKFDIKNQQFTLTVYKGEQKIRVDKAEVKEMDSKSVTYIAEENAIVIKCRGDLTDCFDKETFAKGNNKRDQYARTNIIVEGMDQKSIDGIQKALIHMIKLVQSLKYESAEPFEK